MYSYSGREQSPETVQSYWPVGVAVWLAGDTEHGPACPDLICADTRAHLALEPMS